MNLCSGSSRNRENVRKTDEQGDTYICGVFFPLSSIKSNPRLYAKLLHPGRRKVGQELTNHKVVPIFYDHPRARDRDHAKTKTGKRPDELRRKCATCASGVVIFAFFCFSIPYQKEFFLIFFQTPLSSNDFAPLSMEIGRSSCWLLYALITQLRGAS